MIAGRFGQYGGRYAPEILIAPLQELAESYAAFQQDAFAQAELTSLLTRYAGRETPLYACRNLGGGDRRLNLSETGRSSPWRGT